MAFDPRALLVLLVATCLGVILMAHAHARGAAPTPQMPSEAGSPSAVDEITKPIMNKNRWRQPHA